MALVLSLPQTKQSRLLLFFSGLLFSLYTTDCRSFADTAIYIFLEMNFKCKDTIQIIEYTLKKLFRTLKDISISTHGVFLILRFGEYNENFTRSSLNFFKNHINFPPGFSYTPEINYRKEKKKR